MSDTDDTDDLLLIPPDFFVIDSDSGDSNYVEPYYNIVDNLINQVSALKNRIDSIETISLGNPLDISDPTDIMQDSGPRYQNYSSTDDLYIPQSTQSTPQRPHTKFKLSSLPNSPNIDKFSPKSLRPTKEVRSPVRVTVSPRSARRSTTSSSPDKNDESTLNEVDTFLSKVRTIQRINAARNLENEFNGSEVTTNASNKKEVQQMTAEVPLKQAQNSTNVDKVPAKEGIIMKENTWRQGDYKESLPDYGTGVRDLLYTNIDNKSQGDYIRQYKPNQNQGNDSFSDSSSEFTQLTALNKFNKDRGDLLNSPIHTKALNLLSIHKQLLDEARHINATNKREAPRPRGANTINDNFGLLSLADIWNNNPQLVNSNPSQLSQKLQEEKLRRQHCEELIQELQNRNLELQQKLSVALKVDESKNSTIQQFQDVLEKIVARLERLNKEKQEWDQERTKLKTSHLQEIEEATQRVVYYEKEASKALNLAHGNQDKLSSLEKRCADLQNNLQSIEKRCKDLQEDYSREMERNKQLSDILSQKEIELNENKNVLNNAREEIAQSKRAVEVCQGEFSGIKAECAKLQNDLKQEKDKIHQLTEKKKTLLSEIEGHKRAQEELKTDRDKLKKQLENNKTELKHFYQGQVEILVQNKLKEFQTQLDQAEGMFKEELKKREMSMAKTAATHIQQITEKYNIEIKLLEKKHEEEIKLLQIQIMQHKQQSDNLQSKLDQMQERRVQIAKQLQKIMESQWAEALRIITSGKSPTFNDDTFSTIDQLNTLKMRSYNNVEDLLAQQQDEYNSRKAKNESGHLKADNMLSSISSFERNVQELPEETPVSSRTQGHKQYNESEIQKYMSLLLNRPPGNPTQEGQQREKQSPEGATDRASWHQVDEASISKGNPRIQKDRFPKPPWK